MQVSEYRMSHTLNRASVHSKRTIYYVKNCLTRLSHLHCKQNRNYFNSDNISTHSFHRWGSTKWHIEVHNVTLHFKMAECGSPNNWSFYGEESLCMSSYTFCQTIPRQWEERWKAWGRVWMVDSHNREIVQMAFGTLQRVGAWTHNTHQRTLSPVKGNIWYASKRLAKPPLFIQPKTGGLRRQLWPSGERPS
jgi:hypothetical protein